MRRLMFQILVAVISLTSIPQQVGMLGKLIPLGTATSTSDLTSLSFDPPKFYLLPTNDSNGNLTSFNYYTGNMGFGIKISGGTTYYYVQGSTDSPYNTAPVQITEPATFDSGG